MKHPKLYVWVMAGISALLLTCSSADTAKTRLHVHFKLKAGLNDLALNTTYTINGKPVQFTTVRFYVCQFAYKTALGTEYVTTDSIYHIVEPGNTEWTIPVESGITIDRIRFGFGVDVTRNDSTGALAVPAYDYPADHPLSASQNMYWSWNPGYIFMKLEGRIDLDGNNSMNDPGETFSLHTGLNQSYREITRNVNFNIDDVSDKNIYIDADILRFFDGYDLPGQLNAHPTTTANPEYSYVQELVDNAENVFGQAYQ